MALTVAQIDALMQEGLAVLDARRADWDLTRAKQSLDTTNHVLRVLAQENAADMAREACARLLACQHEDGGWGEFSNDAKSGIREAAFCTRNLVTLNRRLNDPAITASVERAVRYLLAQQEPGGGWLDVLWGRSDSTSISLGALMLAAQDGVLTAEARPAIERGIQFACGMQAEDGGWYDPRFKQETRLSPVAWTAHILPKIVVYQGDTEAARKGLDLMANAMDQDGSWDGGDVDHTCDSTRALILACLVLNDYRYEEKFTRGVRWLVANRNPDGLWSAEPGRPSNLLITCDVYDTFQKYRTYLNERGKDLGNVLARWDDF
ncbi:MAG TPA: prenyltransferase/squalene oxidase repeat-containing protein [Armatimonadota bacterium]|nr:prenyltransferase/squalene oxidase repeat-containing protein [Armatimonadota bacterium]